MPVYETLTYEKDGAVAKISLNRPKVLNAFNGRMHEEIRAAFDAANDDEEVRSIVLRGEGRGFSAGADLSEVVEDEDPDLGQYLRQTYSRLVTQMVAIEKPIIASLHGPVYGAGLGIALACDLRIAAESAKFSVAFIKIGLVNKVIGDDELADATAALAGRLAELPTRALGRIKHSLHASFENDLETALESEAEGQTFCGYTEDHKEGVAAFREKRPASFRGR